VYVRIHVRCVSGDVRTCKKEGTSLVCVEPEVRAGSRTAGASVRQRRHRFGLHAPIIGRLIGRYSATDSALHRFRVVRPRNHTRFRENAARLIALPHARFGAKFKHLDNVFFSSSQKFIVTLSSRNEISKDRLKAIWRTNLLN